MAPRIEVPTKEGCVEGRNGEVTPKPSVEAHSGQPSQGEEWGVPPMTTLEPS